MSASVTFRTTTTKNKTKAFLCLWGFETSHQVLQQKNRFQICVNRLFQVSLGESKPAGEDVTPSCSTQRFLPRVSIPVWVGRVLCCVEGKFQKSRAHGSDPQSLGAALSSLQLVAPLKSTDCIHSMAGLLQQCTLLPCLDYLDSSDLLLCFNLPTPQQMIRPLTCVRQLPVISGG